MFANAMIQLGMFCLLSVPTWFGQDDALQPARVGGEQVADEKAEIDEEIVANRGLSGLWSLSWDDALDGNLGEAAKSCDVRLRIIDQELIGYFDGPVLGKQREAVFLGTVYEGDAPLIMFVQREPGYTCSYHIYWNPGDEGPAVGTWHDSRGGSGEFSLLKYQ